jgi:hypothetical protein
MPRRTPPPAVLASLDAAPVTLKQSMSDGFKLNLGFKGDRTYLHSTDFYDHCSKVCCDLGDGMAWVREMRFHRPVRSGVRLVCGSIVNAPVTVGVQFDDVVQAWSIIDGQGDISLRHPYDEDSLVSRAVIRHSGISMQTSTERSAIEEFVALTKRLHLHLFPGVEGKWVAASFAFTRCLRQYRPRNPCVKLARTLGSSLTECSAHDGTDCIGVIRFALQRMSPRK